MRIDNSEYVTVTARVGKMLRQRAGLEQSEVEFTTRIVVTKEVF